jgi:hypothetical protein
MKAVCVVLHSVRYWAQLQVQQPTAVMAPAWAPVQD